MEHAAPCLDEHVYVSTADAKDHFNQLALALWPWPVSAFSGWPLQAMSTTAALRSVRSGLVTRAPQISFSEFWIFFVGTTPVLWLPIVGVPQGSLRPAILLHRRPDATSAVSPWYTCTLTTRHRRGRIRVRGSRSSYLWRSRRRRCVAWVAAALAARKLLGFACLSATSELSRRRRAPLLVPTAMLLLAPTVMSVPVPTAVPLPALRPFHISQVCACQ